MQIVGAKALREFDTSCGFADLPLPVDTTLTSAVAQSPRAHTTSTIMLCTKQISNEELAHEIALDPKFRCDNNGFYAKQDPMFARVRAAYEGAFWDSLVSDIELRPPVYSRVVRVIGEIHDFITDVAPHTKVDSATLQAISTLFDIDAIKTALDDTDERPFGDSAALWDQCVKQFERVVGILERMQAPGRLEVSEHHVIFAYCC